LGEQGTILFQRQGCFALRFDQFLVLDLQFGLINTQFLDEMLLVVLCIAARRIRNTRACSLDGLQGTFTKFCQVDRLMTHDDFPSWRAVTLT